MDDKTRSRLRYRVDRLCFQCHKDLSPEAPKNRGLWLHGPFKAGVCLGCHDPHESDNPKLLVAYPWASLCGRCHPDYHGGRGAPSRGSDCRSCHSPHARPVARTEPEASVSETAPPPAPAVSPPPRDPASPR